MKITANNKNNVNVETMQQLLEEYYNDESYREFLKVVGIDGQTHSANSLDVEGLNSKLPEKERMNNLSADKGARAEFNGSYNKRPVYTEVNIDLDLQEPQKSKALGIIQDAITNPEFEFTCSNTQEKGKVWGTKPAMIAGDEKMFVYNRSIGQKSISEETAFSNEGYLKAQCDFINKKLADAGIDHEITYEIDNEPKKQQEANNDVSRENAHNGYFEEKGIVYDENKSPEQLLTEYETMEQEIKEYKEKYADTLSKMEETKNNIKEKKEKLRKNNDGSYTYTAVLRSTDTEPTPEQQTQDQQVKQQQDDTPQEEATKQVGIVDKIKKAKEQTNEPTQEQANNQRSRHKPKM